MKFTKSLRTVVLRTMLVAVTAAALTSCGRYSYNTEISDREMQNNSYVYGNYGAPPRQTANTYPANPEAIGRAADLREAMFATKTSPRATHVPTTRVGQGARIAGGAQTSTPVQAAPTQVPAQNAPAVQDAPGEQPNPAQRPQ
jgi:hypothetical protein